jgi:uncharacterized membrane protein
MSANPPQPSTLSTRTPRKRGRMGPRSTRGRLLAGILIIVPVAITVLIVQWVYSLALWAGTPLMAWARQGLKILFRLDASPDLGPTENIFAVCLTLVVLYLLGWLGSNVVGQRMIGLAESLLGRIPFVDTTYNTVKRVLHALSGARGGDGSQQVVVLIEFPTPPLMVIAFMTNTVTDTRTGQKYATVFVPTTPNPTSGYMEFVPIEKVIVTDWTMEEALTTVLSGGASAPEGIELSKLIDAKPPGRTAETTRPPADQPRARSGS